MQMYMFVTEVLQKSKIFTHPASLSLTHPWASPGICNFFSLSAQQPYGQAGRAVERGGVPGVTTPGPGPEGGPG